MFDGHGVDLSSEPISICASEYRERQSRLLREMEPGSILVLSNNPHSTRSADVEYPYRSNSDILYLVGWTMPDATFCLYESDDAIVAHLFVPERDVTNETWTGIRPGIEGAVSEFPIDIASNLENRKEDLSNLLNRFKRVYHVRGLDTDLDGLVDDSLLAISRERQRTGDGPVDLCDPRPLLAEMRLRKSEAEINLMRHAAKIASAAHIETMMHASPNVTEYQLQAIIEGCFTHNGSQWSYPSIVGGGDNATILHYVENNAEVGEGNLVLIDAGCEVQGYASDITRTWPVSGSFSDDQRTLYQLVLDAEMAAIDACQPGAGFDEPHEAAKRVMAQGLMDLGIIEGPTMEDALGSEQLGQFFMHRTSHWLGLDVHDVGVYAPDKKPRKLEPGMVLTIEPGLYFGAWRPDIEIDERWLGIGIRIEDDILITEDGHEVLTSDCPKTISDLEALIGAA